ncbi:MAG TPA: extracellular solute-binding protein [Anaerolineaceae bacterium]|nr:extracellular solute-binding protein [Anaerolineaceae bacterium]
MKVKQSVSLFSVLMIVALAASACINSGSSGSAAPTPTVGSMPLTGETPPAGAAPSQPPAAVPTASTVPATSAPAAELKPVTSKELNLYGWSEYIPQQLLDDFSKAYNLKVNYDTYSSNEELMAKLQAGASGYDVIIPSDYTVAIMVKQGLLEPLDLSQIPNLSNVDERFRSLDFDPGNLYTVPYQWGTTGLAVNTAKVTKKIDSWQALWDPAYKQRVVMLDDEREVLGLVLRVLGYDTNSTDPKQLNEAKAKLTELMPNVKLFDSDSPKTALLSGEVWLGLTWNGEAALAHQQNPAIQYSCPKEGCVIWYDNLAVPKGAPHLDAAQAFLNFVLTPEESILITREFPYSNPNKAALGLLQQQDPDAYKAYMDFPATNPSEADIKNAKTIKDVGDATTLWDQIWTEVKGK